MIAADAIVGRMDVIRTTFETGKLAAEEHTNDDEVIAVLSKLDKEYQSVAYEGAAMGRAVADIVAGEPYQRWAVFLQKNIEHAVQIHIGLGWALSSKKIADLASLSSIEPLLKARVLDGYGYCDGTFRQRLTIGQQQIHSFLTDTDLVGYDQGIGRSIWYITRGDTTILPKLIDPFWASRKPHLWRGIGIAMTYVGGVDESTLKAIIELASVYRSHLGVGALLAYRSRYDAQSLNRDTVLACQLLSGLDATQAIVPTTNTTKLSYSEYLDLLATHISLFL